MNAEGYTTTLQAEVLATLQALGPGWHSRAKIAAQMGKKTLNQAEVFALDLLAERGVINRQYVDGPRRNVKQWEYEAK